MPAVSEAQRKAMYAAAEGRSTLGIPKSVGEEFVGAEDECPHCGGKLAGDAMLCEDCGLGKHVDILAMDRDSVRTFDVDGHLHVATTPVSKANVCEYYGREIPDSEGLGLSPDRKYKLLRDPDELAKAAPTWARKPLLLVHTPVSADGHPREATVGTIGDDVQFDGPYLRAPLTVWDGEAIKLIQSGRQRELSSSYRYRADMTPGEYKGEKYDGVMRDIACNHVALVREGRAGADVVVNDETPDHAGWVLIEQAIMELV